jgi:uncharacterized OsmC-like protein
MSRLTRLLLALCLLLLVLPLGAVLAQGESTAAEPAVPLTTAAVTANLAEPMRAIVHARSNHFVVDSVPPLGSPSEEKNPLDLLLAALATCPVFVYEKAAAELAIPLERIQVKAEGDLAPQGVKDGSVDPRIRAFRLLVELEGPSVEQADLLREQFKLRCPIYTTLVRAAPIEVVHVGMDLGAILEIDFTYDLTAEEYVAAVTPLAEQFAAVDGLAWKIWTQNTAQNRAGAVMLFRDDAARQAFLDSELAATVMEHPALSDFRIASYAVMGAETRLTHGPVDPIARPTAPQDEAGTDAVGHLLEVNFRYTVPTADFQAVVSPLAEQFAQTAGLKWKIWALNEATSEFSGILYFADAAAMQAFLEGELATAITTHPALSDFVITDFAIMAEPSAVTRAPIR